MPVSSLKICLFQYEVWTHVFQLSPIFPEYTSYSRYFFIARKSYRVFPTISACLHRDCRVLVSFTIVYHPLLGQNHKQSINFKHSHPRCDDHRHLARPIKVAVYVMLVKHQKKELGNTLKEQKMLEVCFQSKRGDYNSTCKHERACIQSCPIVNNQH